MEMSHVKRKLCKNSSLENRMKWRNKKTKQNKVEEREKEDKKQHYSGRMAMIHLHILWFAGISKSKRTWNIRKNSKFFSLQKSGQSSKIFTNCEKGERKVFTYAF